MQVAPAIAVFCAVGGELEDRCVGCGLEGGWRWRWRRGAESKGGEEGEQGECQEEARHCVGLTVAVAVACALEDTFLGSALTESDLMVSDGLLTIIPQIDSRGLNS